MFQRIIDGLFNPSQIVQYRNDKKIVAFFVLVFYAVLLMIPSIIALYISKPFDYDVKVAIRNSFLNNTEIPYVIENNKLTFVGETEKTQYYINVDELNLTVCFSTQEKIILEKQMLGNVIVFDTNCVYFYNTMENITILNYYEYDQFYQMDFRMARNDQQVFWDSMFNVIQEIIDNNDALIKSASLVIIVFQAFFLVLMVTLLLTLFNRFGSKNIYSFGTHWKLMIYFSGPFVLGFLFATLFNTMIFEYAGLIITLIYSLKINQINFIKGE